MRQATRRATRRRCGRRRRVTRLRPAPPARLAGLPAPVPPRAMPAPPSARPAPPAAPQRSGAAPGRRASCLPQGPPRGAAWQWCARGSGGVWRPAAACVVPAASACLPALLRRALARHPPAGRVGVGDGAAERAVAVEPAWHWTLLCASRCRWPAGAHAALPAASARVLALAAQCGLPWRTPRPAQSGKGGRLSAARRRCPTRHAHLERRPRAPTERQVLLRSSDHGRAAAREATLCRRICSTKDALSVCVRWSSENKADFRCHRS